MRRVATRVQEAPGLGILGGRRPARGFEQSEQLGFRNSCIGKSPRRPAFKEQRIDRVLGMARVFGKAGIYGGHVEAPKMTDRARVKLPVRFNRAGVVSLRRVRGQCVRGISAVA